MSLRRAARSGAALVLALLAAISTTASPTVYWLQAQPADDGEAALLAALSTSGSAAPSLDALRAVSDAHPGTAVSGLAQLAAGLLLVDQNRPVEAMACLTHRDVQRTALADRALLGLARALEGTRAYDAASQTYQQLVDADPQGSLACSALFRGADSQAAAGHAERALPILERMLKECSGRAPEALLRLGSLQERRGDRRAAAVAYDRLDAEYPASLEAREAAKRLKLLQPLLPTLSAAEHNQHDIGKALALADAGRYREAVPLFRGVLARSPSPEQAEMVRLRLGRALLALDQDKAAQALLAAIPRTSPFGGEAAYHLAKITARQSRSLAPYEAVVAQFKSTPWAEEALLDMAQHYDRDARDAEALPYYRRLLQAFPDGRYVDRATWMVGWSDYHQGRYEAAIKTWEGAARSRPKGPATARYLYWSGRARAALGQNDRARALYQETVRRFKHAYHGLRAGAALGLVREGASSTSPAPPPTSDAKGDVPEPQLTRIHQLLLIGRLDDALEELRRVNPSPPVQATIAWIEWQRGQLRPAITDMRRAYPQWVSESGDDLPETVWHILYPLQYADALLAQAKAEGLDAALVAAVIWQESTFDAGAVSGAGARGLMQVVPKTGRTLARGLGVPYKPAALHDAATSLKLGTHYLRQMIDSFGGRVDKALAAYNAGPTRVRTWSTARAGLSPEEFIESIPFTETRNYVTGILTHQEHYRQLYGLPAAGGRLAQGGP